MRFSFCNILLLFFTLFFTSPGFSDTWYVSVGGGLGNQTAYNFIAEQEFYQEKIIKAVQKTGIESFKINMALNDTERQTKLDNLYESSKHNWTRSELKQILDHKNIWNLPQTDLYALRDQINPYKESLDALDSKQREFDCLLSRSLLTAGKVTVGYHAGSFAIEGGGLMFNSNVAFSNVYDDHLRSYQTLLSASEDTKNTLLYGGIINYKRFIKILPEVNVYVQGGIVLLRGTNDALLSSDHAKPQRITLPWCIAFLKGFGVQYQFSQKWTIEGSWMMITERNCIPSCNLLTISGHYTFLQG